MYQYMDITYQYNNVIIIHYDMHLYVVTSIMQYKKSCTYILQLNIYIYVNKKKIKYRHEVKITDQCYL